MIKSILYLIIKNIEFFLDKATDNTDSESEIYMSGNLSKYPIRDYIGFFSEINNVIKQYNKLGKRNAKKDKEHLSKHMMHLVRLYLMCFDILENEKIITYREKDIDFLMSIRNGKFLNVDNTISNDFFDLVNELETRLKYDAKNTNLPDEPNYKKINEFRMSVNENIVKGI